MLLLVVICVGLLLFAVLVLLCVLVCLSVCVLVIMLFVGMLLHTVSCSIITVRINMHNSVVFIVIISTMCCIMISD